MPTVGRVVTFTGPHEAVLADEPEQPLGPAEVRVETLFSGISAGTELTEYRGSNPFLHRRWEPERRLFVDHESTRAYPLAARGYEEVGRVVDVGTDVRGVEPGALVWGAWGHRSSAIVPGERAGSRLLPEGMPPLGGIFGRIGAIALNAVLDADIHVGEIVAVFGQGVPGLLATQLAALNGGTVVAVERIPRRLELARSLGAAHAVDLTRERPAEAIKELTDGLGADVTIEISGSYEALHEAIRATAFNSRVVAAGFFQGGGSALRLGEEFHHNRVELVCSQISGVSPRLDHRWDATRLERTVMQLAADGRIDVQALVSHVLPAERAPEAFRLLDEHPDEAVQVVLAFQEP
jgi:2-desacetyl-2-hydroxyethyl bacteriochlorophyllide A dehydrogenase